MTEPKGRSAMTDTLAAASRWPRIGGISAVAIDGNRRADQLAPRSQHPRRNMFRGGWLHEETGSFCKATVEDWFGRAATSR